MNCRLRASLPSPVPYNMVIEQGAGSPSSSKGYEMKTNGRNITKNINGYKVELFERRPATRVAYPAYCGECIDEEYGQEYDVVAGGKFLGRARREILVKFARGGRKYGKPTWVFYDEFMGDAVDASMDKSLTACIKRQIRNDEWYGHIGDLVKYGYKCSDYDYENGGDMPDFGMYRELK